MDNPSTLRRKAARFFEDAASSKITDEAEKLVEVGRQLELWADDLEEMLVRPSQSVQSSGGARGEPITKLRYASRRSYSFLTVR